MFSNYILAKKGATTPVYEKIRTVARILLSHHFVKSIALLKEMFRNNDFTITQAKLETRYIRELTDDQLCGLLQKDKEEKLSASMYHHLSLVYINL